MSASDIARGGQGNKLYPATDKWQDGKAQEGEIVYRWEVQEGKGGNFYTTPEEIERCTNPTTGEVDAHKLGDRMQVASHQDIDTGATLYKGQLSAYEVPKGTAIATGTCRENTCYGKGGGEQVYIPDNKNLHRREDLDKPIDKDSTKVDTGRYEQQQKDLKNLRKQEQAKSAEQNTDASRETQPSGKIAQSVPTTTDHTPTQSKDHGMSQ